MNLNKNSSMLEEVNRSWVKFTAWFAALTLVIGFVFGFVWGRMW